MAARTKRPKTLDEIPLRIRAEMALQEAVAEAIAEHKRRGRPIVVWRHLTSCRHLPEALR